MLKTCAAGYTPSTGTGTGSDNAVFGFTSTKEITKYMWPCHAYLRNAPEKETFSVWSVWCKPHPKKLDPAIVKDHFDWLVDAKHSPWRSLLKIDSYGGKQFQWDYGFIFQKLSDIPANLLMNFLVATRMPKEWPDSIAAWHRLVTEYKIDPAMAYTALRLFTCLIGDVIGDKGTENEQFILNTANYYDWPLDNGTCTEEYVYNFIRGIPGAPEHPFAQSHRSYTSINNIWGPIIETDARCKPYAKVLHDRYGKMIGNHNYSGSVFDEDGDFIESDGSTLHKWAIPFEQVIKILKRETKRSKEQDAKLKAA